MRGYMHVLASRVCMLADQRDASVQAWRVATLALCTDMLTHTYTHIHTCIKTQTHIHIHTLRTHTCFLFKRKHTHTGTSCSIELCLWQVAAYMKTLQSAMPVEAPAPVVSSSLQVCFQGVRTCVYVCLCTRTHLLVRTFTCCPFLAKISTFWGLNGLERMGSSQQGTHFVRMCV